MDDETEHRANGDLRSLAADLVKRLGGYMTRSGAMCHCPAHEDRRPSLSVRIGTRALLFKCFAGCDIEVVLRALGRADHQAFRHGQGISNSDHAARENYLRERARDIWDSSVTTDSSPAQTYLAARGLSAHASALRFNPRTPLGIGRSVTSRPALIAAVHQAGRLVAIQRIFLDLQTGWKAHDLADPCRLLGRPLGGAVVLSPASDVLGLAEGVETALSAALLLRIPVWAALGSERLYQIQVPATVRRLLILPDNDRSGRLGARKALAGFSQDGRTVEVRLPWGGVNDWNDVLRRRFAIPQD